MSQFSKFVTTLLALSTLALAACSGSSSGMIPASNPVSSAQSSVPNGIDDGLSVLKFLNKETTIGSAVDPMNGDQNPYGLDIAHTTSGSISAGDLVACNFNDSANVQGNGTTVIALHPTPGASPTHVAKSAALKGCTALALAPSGPIWAAAFVANDNPILTPGGVLLTTLAGGPFHGPFGQIFSPHPTPFGNASFYESNASDGSIVRINIKSGPMFTFDVIARGFAVNGGPPGSILGPSGLQYNDKTDTLYIVDGANNTVATFSKVSTIPAGGITVSGTKFSGPFALRARLLFSGPPLNGPISSALLPDGHIVIGNTLDPTGENLMVELNSAGKVLAVKNVDSGASGALFGMVATPTGDQRSPNANGDEASVKLYFNDDNDNTVKVLSR